MDPELPKSGLDYQTAPLIVEPRAFAVYMVDGRMRVGCMLSSFLHASARGGSNTTVLVHDCEREEYHVADDIFNLVKRSEKLCVYQRFPNTTDEQILEKWNDYYQLWAR